ncbi:MAG: hypothetical protein K2J15_03135, partial [Muribaculaceae bacterium]|nr:hypothetical protein [Muribaculaceae bacterium]
MTKLLLPAALMLLSATSIYADDDELMEFTDCFRITCNGEDIEDGATLEIHEFEDMSALYGPGAVTYSANIKIENLDIMPTAIDGTLLFTGKPSAAEYQADPYYWGDPQLCYELEKNGGLAGSCLESKLPFYAGTGCFEVPVEGVGSFRWIIHLSAAQITADETYTLSVQAKMGTEPGAPNLSYPFRFSMHFSADNSAVGAISPADDAPVQWFDLQGRSVDNPATGLY